MANDPLTPFLRLYKPIVNDEAGEDLWGEKLNTNFDILDVFASSQGVLNEAPEDGRIYGRQNRSWTETIEKAVYDVDIGEIVSDNDAQDVSIAAGAAAIAVNTADIDALEAALIALDAEVDGKVGEAPDDGGQYVRQSLSWQLVDIPEPLDAYTKPESDARYEPIDTMYTKAESDARYANVTGDAMTGFLTLHADPTATMHASTKQYVDNKVGTVPAGATISDAPPGGAVSGQFWLESDSGTLFVYWADPNSSQWVDVSGSSALGNYLPLSGGTLTGDLKLDKPTVGGSERHLDFTVAGKIAWALRTHTDGHFYITRHTAATGVAVDNPLKVDAATGMLTVNAGFTSAGGATFSTTLAVTGTATFASGVAVTGSLQVAAQIFPAATTGSITTAGYAGLEVRSVGAADAAYIAFHRPAGFACYFGLDTDNQLSVGGWSYGAVSYKIWSSNNFGRPTVVAGIGQFVSQATAPGGAFVLPAGGTWAYAVWGYNTSYQIAAATQASVAAGGTTVIAGAANVTMTGFVWRVA